MTDSRNTETGKLYYVGVSVDNDGKLHVFTLNGMFKDKSLALEAKDRICSRLKDALDDHIEWDVTTVCAKDETPQNSTVGDVIVVRPDLGYDKPRFGKTIMSDSTKSGQPRHWTRFLMKKIKLEWESEIEQAVEDDYEYDISMLNDTTAHVDVDGEHEYYYEIVKLSKAETVSDEEIDRFVEQVKSESEW